MSGLEDAKVVRNVNLAGAPATLYGSIYYGGVMRAAWQASIRMRYNGGNEIIVKDAGAGFETEKQALTWCRAAIDNSGVSPMEVR